ncbi:hypothetical protein EVAR_12504_1 [Eumeta japonica]|uniref:Uncharacterized protein n=1 Tax=Eumeta variegata TaxID=151549 RepID=A0A4C1TPN4_EUMVA|nr:hypothetical protein EVAR_12504_1 [Eumeta japonica]
MELIRADGYAIYKLQRNWCIHCNCTPAVTCEARAALNKSEHRNAVHNFAYTPQESILRGDCEENRNSGLRGGTEIAHIGRESTRSELNAGDSRPISFNKLRRRRSEDEAPSTPNAPVLRRHRRPHKSGRASSPATIAEAVRVLKSATREIRAGPAVNGRRRAPFTALVRGVPFSLASPSAGVNGRRARVAGVRRAIAPNKLNALIQHLSAGLPVSTCLMHTSR